MNVLKRYARAAVDLLLPRCCVVCGRKLNVDETHLCLYCLADIPLTRFWMQNHNPMADRFNAVLQKGLEKAWEEQDFPLDEHERYAYAAALFFYNSEAGYRHIPYNIKYQYNIKAGRYFGNMLGRKLMEADWFKDVDMVIPVPLHWRRRWSRGYNQAEVIAGQVAEALGASVRTDILQRTRSTETQTKLSVAEKAANVSGAFEATASAASGNSVRHILLIDDVFTTGATLSACFTALRSVFPPSVRISVATLAYVGGP